MRKKRTKKRRMLKIILGLSYKSFSAPKLM